MSTALFANLAQDAGAETVQAVMDNLWLVIAGCLVFLMQAGFAFVEAGLTRAKNLANIMAKNLADMAVGVTMFFIVGWTIAYGAGGNDSIDSFSKDLVKKAWNLSLMMRKLGKGHSPRSMKNF